MIEIRTLTNVAPSDIFHTFQDAFSDYFVPMNVAEEIMLLRWQSAGVDYDLSYGAFDKNKLVAFILHAPREHMVFNLGTGVIPVYRGQKLIDKIYHKALPELLTKGFPGSELEVITKNTAAIKVYERNGFKIRRELKCFKGTIPSLPWRAFTYIKKDVHFTEEMRNLISYPFSFEQSESSLTRIPGLYELHEIHEGNSLEAYAIYNPALKNFAQICTRRWETIPSLFKSMNLENETVRMNNVDVRNTELINFWESLNFENHISQYEMKRGP